MMEALSHLSAVDAVRAPKRTCWDVSSPVDLTISPSGFGGHMTPTLAESMRMDKSLGPPSPVFSLGSAAAAAFGPSRKPREFIPDQKKDDCYWDRRRRNNEAAKRYSVSRSNVLVSCAADVRFRSLGQRT